MPYDRYPAVDQNLELPPSVLQANQAIALTTSQRDALSAARKWDGRMIYNSTSKRYERWDSAGSIWRTIADQQDMSTLLDSTGTPTTEAAASARGTSNFAARADHTHAMVKTEVVPTFDVNTNASNVTKLQMRGNMVFFVYDFSVKITWNSSWPLMIFPAGWRPTHNLIFVGVNASTGAAANMQVSTLGELRIYSAFPTAGQFLSGSASWGVA